MSIYTIKVDNLKCGGCAATITNAIQKQEGVSSVTVDPDTSLVKTELEGDNNEELINKIKEILGRLGYPEEGTGNGMQKVKSYVSCAIGRIS